MARGEQLTPDNRTASATDFGFRLATGILGAFVMFLAGWVWNMERRTTTLEVQRAAMYETVQEIKTDVKEIRRLVTDHR